MRLIFVGLLSFCIAFTGSLKATADEVSLVEAGVPALSREWSGDDYLRVAEVLASGKVPLPQLSDDQGKAFLRRLTDTGNLSLCRNRSLPLEQRMDHIFKMMGGGSAILKQYMAAANRGVNVHAEVAQILVFSLRSAAAGVQLIDEFLPTIPKDEKYSIRMDGLKRANGGLTSMFVGAETSLSERNFYADNDLSLIIEAMAETLPTVKQAFAPDYKVELRKKLEGRKGEFQRANDTQKIQQMIVELGS